MSISVNVPLDKIAHALVYADDHTDDDLIKFIVDLDKEIGDSEFSKKLLAALESVEEQPVEYWYFRSFAGNYWRVIQGTGYEAPSEIYAGDGWDRALAWFSDLARSGSTRKLLESEVPDEIRSAPRKAVA